MNKPLSPIYVLGPNGSFSSQGAGAFLAEQGAQSRPIVFCSSFPAIFEKIQSDSSALGIVPIQNGSTSSVHENVDLFFRHTDFEIFGEFLLPIQLHILGINNASMNDITDVYSHPKAFEQCHEFFQKFEGNIHYCKSTAEAAEQINVDQEVHKAVLGSDSLCENNLSILQENIQDHDVNETQFVFFGQKGGRPNCSKIGKKWTVHFECQHKPGALAEILEIISAHGGDLLKIESRPIPNERGRFRFWLDILASNASPKLADILPQKTIDFRWVGTYPKGKIIDLHQLETQLVLHRNSLDIIDEKIINLLGERQKLVHKIATVKKNLEKQVEQPERWKEVLQNIEKNALQNNLDPNFVKDMYALVHQNSIAYQKNTHD